MGALQTLDTATSAAASAVVWLNGREAVIALVGRDGQVSQTKVDRGTRTELEYLADIVREIGDRERVMILGPNEVRLDLEREYVAIYRRPERLVDVEPAGRLDAEALVRRARRLLIRDRARQSSRASAREVPRRAIDTIGDRKMNAVVRARGSVGCSNSREPACPTGGNGQPVEVDGRGR